MPTISEEIQKLTPSTLVELFVLDATVAGGGVSYFHAGTNALTQPVVWDGDTYTPYPIEASGFEATGKGALPRPSLRVANIGGAIGAMCAATDDLVGAKLTRKRTFQRFLDEVNFPSSFGPSGVNVEFTRASIGTYFDAAGVMQVAADGVARFDHDPVTHSPLGLLIEEARTNLFTYSSEFDNSAWSKSRCTITPNAAAAPDGTTTADLLLESGTAGASYLYRGSTWTFTAGNDYTLAVYFKYHKDQRPTLQFPTGNGFAVGVSATFDLQTGTVYAGTGTIEALDNGWYRCSIVGTCTSTYTGTWIAILLASSNSDPTSGFYLWDAQCEVGAFPSSYIPTTTAAVTRAADVPKLTGTNFSDWYNQSQGTLVATAIVSSGPSAGTLGKSVMYASNNSTTEQINCVKQDANTMIFGMTTGGVGQVGSAGLTTVPDVPGTYAMAYQQNNYRAALNGVLGTPDTTCEVPTVDRLYLGVQYNGSGRWLDGTIASVAYYDTRLSDADLQTLSAGGSIITQPTMSIDFTTGSLEINQWGYYNPEADPNAHLPDDVYFVNRKVNENSVFVEFELASALDVQGIKLPRRQIIQNVCTWGYRSSECGYTGGSVADKNDQTPPGYVDQCGKRLSSCKLRFGTYAELPYGGFPGAGLQRG